jgi:hypothetical protein
MGKSYDYSKVWLSEDEANELVERIAIVLVDEPELSEKARRDLVRAQELAMLVLTDITEGGATYECGHPARSDDVGWQLSQGEVVHDVCDDCFNTTHPNHIERTTE